MYYWLGRSAPTNFLLCYQTLPLPLDAKDMQNGLPSLQVCGLGYGTHSASAAYKPPLPSGARASRQGCSRIRRPSGVRQGSSPCEHAHAFPDTIEEYAAEAVQRLAIWKSC